jgi:ribosomal protein S30
LGGWGVLYHQAFHVWGGGAGKVHGSLARAGKVRGQTPKVAKQDKKKKPTGRAHKRMQYNRRFVTAGTPQETPTFSSPVFFVFQADTIWVRVLHLALEFFHISLFCFDTRQCFVSLFSVLQLLDLARRGALIPLRSKWKSCSTSSIMVWRFAVEVLVFEANPCVSCFWFI